jgi:hypothetical protein
VESILNRDKLCGFVSTIGFVPDASIKLRFCSAPRMLEFAAGRPLARPYRDTAPHTPLTVHRCMRGVQSMSPILGGKTLRAGNDGGRARGHLRPKMGLSTEDSVWRSLSRHDATDSRLGPLTDTWCRRVRVWDVCVAVIPAS